MKTLVDGQGRRLDYLRLSVTDRCNLRCRYCMPADGIDLLAHEDILSWEEMHRLCALLTRHGVGKIRITGGEPLARKGLIDFISGLSGLPERPRIVLTTNGVLLGDQLDDLRRAGVSRINLSLDSLDPRTYRDLARRDGLDLALQAMQRILEAGLPLKINVVVLPGYNDGELLDFAMLTRERDMDVRFIEAMPFCGDGGARQPTMSASEILRILRTALDMTPLRSEPGSTAEVFAPAGHRGRVGLIRAHKRTFCADCNRLRIDARGRLRTCLYGRPALDLRSLLRSGAADGEIIDAVCRTVNERAPDGHVSEANQPKPISDSMSSIGG